MFRSLFNYTKLSIWSVIFLLNFKIYDKIDLDLLQILLYNIQKTNSLAIKCIQKLIPYLKMSNTRKEIIDILNDVYENNIYHSDNISLKMFKHDFNDNFYNKYLLLERLSSGSIGQVYKIQEIESGKIYAMKVLHKDEVKKQHQVEHTQTERWVLAETNHPFITSLRFAFQSVKKLYLVRIMSKTLTFKTCGQKRI